MGLIRSGAMAFALGLAGFCCVATTANAADTSPQTTVGGLTVTGPSKPPQPPTRSVIGKYVRAHGFAGGKIEQLARWDDPVCPVAFGLPAAYDAFLVKRITDIAASVGAPVPTKTPCVPNVEIIVTPNPQAFMNDVRKHAPELMGFHWIADSRRMATVKHPIQAWYATATRNLAGEEYLDDSCCSGPAADAHTSSHFTLGLVSLFKGVLIVADADKVSDYTIGSVADYMALVALSRPGAPDQCGALPSITDLLSPKCGGEPDRQALSEADSAYLKALYAANLNYVLQSENAEIVERMRAQGDHVTSP